MWKNFLIAIALIVAACIFFHHPQAHWQGQLAPDDPIQSSDNLPLPWKYKDFTINPRANYHIKALVLSKHHYWGFWTEDKLSSYDLALGWGPMSDAKFINQLSISQGGRWYFYRWSKNSPIDPSVITYHSSNHHIIAANQDVLDVIASFKRYDVIEMKGYLVDIQSDTKNWSWQTSLTKYGAGAGSCKVFWVTSAFTLN